jgi:5-methylcytosine-specific restriction endonuclease McrA
LENSDKRGWKDHHLDHIYPISLAFKEKIPPEKVGNIKNLRFIPYQENLSKGSKVTNESKNALRRIKRLK